MPKEPQNWILHHQNYQGHRFSRLKEINTDNVKDLRVVFTIGLGGIEAAASYANGNLEATPLVEDGIMYVTDGWGSVYAIDVTPARRASSNGSSIPAPTAPGRVTSPAAASTIAASHCGRTR